MSSLPEPIQKELEELYLGHYRTIFKPLLAEVEVKMQILPAPILNELRSFVDHVSRAYSDEFQEKDKSEEIRKARGHIKRAIYDCFKYIDYYYDEEILKIEKKFKRCDWTTIDNGKFFVQYREKKEKALKAYHSAKREGKRDFDEILKFYEEAYNAYTELYDLVIANLSHLHWAQVKFDAKFWIVIVSLAFFTIAGGWKQTVDWYNYVKDEVIIKHFFQDSKK